MYEKIASSITALNIENEDLRGQVETLRKELAAKNKSEKSLQKRLSESESMLKTLRSEKKASDKKSTKLENSLTQERKLVEKRTKQLEISEKENDTYKRQVRDLEKLRAEVEELRSREKGLKTLNKTNNIDVVKRQVKRVMISLLMESSLDFETLEKELARRELLMNRLDLFSIFKEINQEYTVSISTESKSSPCYSIENPVLKSYQVTSLTNHPTDIILTSDWHTYELDDTHLFRNIDLLLEYCAKYGITITVNLGDFFDYQLNGSLTRAQNSIEAQKRLETLIQKIPYQKGMTNYVMGANHDEILRRYRLDSLKIIESMRPDYISLGYHHAILDINGNLFGLHHPETKFNNLKEYKNGLKSWSQYEDFNAEDMYMNLFGHFHEYKFFAFDGILSCPSLSRDFKRDGAIHLRLHYNYEGQISYMEIIPLNINNYIKRCKAQEYQKRLKPNSNK